ncbi:hypothetical protein GH714_011714 [Hevea brasiliensis]|uniref:Subtilisin-like protease fibronectin type-III domain-containing protein n=1 Tax=Hevea brasiliensis TaxID=3981 RepID=A0A6A6NGL8_HEVBR|nr:hypothetical protein GH714_011714 [Hevea brasiliensis]
MDKAVEDGVNVISMSIGGGLFDYYRDTVAIGAFTATAHGILVSCSAGNDGPSNVSNSTSGFLCMSGTLIPAKVSGKIVICDRGGNSRVEKGVEVKHAGGLGMILANTELYGEELIADSHILATAAMGQSSAAAIKNYAFSDPKPVATIASGRTRLGVEPSPVVAHSVLEVQIQSPQRRVTFNIISGTSMSCPHVSGLAALLKAAHSDWSPGAIRSALMTTAYTKYKNGKTILDVSTGQPSTPLDYGAGYVNPVAALDPGLVYDTTVEDYLGFLCALNYSSSQIKLATNRDFTCDPSKKYSLVISITHLSLFLSKLLQGKGWCRSNKHCNIHRTLTNVAPPATYKVSISSETPSVNILVEPQSLNFSEQYEKKSYTVTFTATSMPSGTTSFAHLEWSSRKHVVGSPIAFSWT